MIILQAVFTNYSIVLYDYQKHAYGPDKSARYHLMWGSKDAYFRTREAALLQFYQCVHDYLDFTIRTLLD